LAERRVRGGDILAVSKTPKSNLYIEYAIKLTKLIQGREQP